MPLRIDIHNDMKAALKGGDKERLTTIRMLLAAIKQQEVDERIELSDAQVIAVAGKLVKQRRESADAECLQTAAAFRRRKTQFFA